ncbi:hypothetical protein L2E82_28880 [Cichorium intybus]|uniref:Uncharacterized protein n=1 Tax=Cichorium intybus TaxID=13427 RepID=A0ACB9CWS2_CICIN|nr:hypothetical protein L2E82_28880 [Cichorium intybus]
MALVLLRLIFLTIFLRFIAAQQTNGSVSVGASLIATPNVKPWLSSSGEFAFGFQQVQGSDSFLLSIWYDKIADKTVIWYPEEGPLVPTGSKVELIRGSGLVLSNPQGRQIWTSGPISDLAFGHMNDTGNFVIVGSNSRKIWDSFDFPADTMLPAQLMVRGGVINSKMSNTNYSGGRFQLRLLQNGNLVLNTRNIPSGFAYEPYYISGTYDAINSTNSGERVIFDETGDMYILRGSGQRFDLTTRGAVPSGDYYHRATLDSDGVFRQYYYPKNPTGNTSWEVIWFEPENICLNIRGNQDSGACGFNNVCSFDGNRPTCACPQGFSLLDPNDANGDCKPDFTPSCHEVESNNGRDTFDFIELNGISWPQSDYEHMNPANEQSCKSSCLEDCFCAVAAYRDGECWKKRFPLSNGRKVASANVKSFLKFRKGDIPGTPPRLLGKYKDQRTLILVGSVLLGTCVSVIVVLTVAICVGFFVIYKKKVRNTYPSSNAIENNLPHFTYQELDKATNGFKDELGKGAFGIVYKGVIGKTMVAVKKLNRLVQDGEKEFKTEVDSIARTHHKNLVQLLGYCDEGEQRLLIYEYMSNGTLAVFLFGDTRPTWKERSYIAVGIAKGLRYLHEECSAQIIHCDIKPQNILLDEYFNAKISDFGLAKLLLMNQSRTNTGIRGTKGYVAPEWFRNTPITVKVDVYSFGVLLLEIISCRKSLVLESEYEGVSVLTDLAWDYYLEGRLDAFVEKDLEALDDYKNLTRFVMVGLWCIQENSLLRPTMRKVVQMLEGEIEVAEPPCPGPLSVTTC